MPSVHESRWVPNYVSASEVDFSTGIGQTARNVMEGGINNPSPPTFVKRVAAQVVFANYTAVTVKAQASLTSGVWNDITGAEASASGDIITFPAMDTGGPYVQWRLHITATLSASADTMTIDVLEELFS